MAQTVDEVIKSGIYRVYDAALGKWKRFAFWTTASQVQIDDSTYTLKSAMTDKTTISSSVRIASAKAVKTVNDSLNSKFGSDKGAGYSAIDSVYYNQADGHVYANINGVSSPKKLGSGEGTAFANQVLKGATFSSNNTNGDVAEGTMSNNGAYIYNASGSEQVTIPEGYHNGKGYVSCSGSYDAGRMDCTGTFVSETTVGDSVTDITVDNLIEGHKYAFIFSQYRNDAAVELSCVSGLNEDFYLYQSNVYLNVSGAPGIVIGVTNSNSVVFRRKKHNGGFAVSVILLY